MSDPENDPDKTTPASGVASDGLGTPNGETRPDPLKAARAIGKPVLPKRFYRQAGLKETEGSFCLTLDGRPARTPARRPLVMPTLALAERVTAEWEAQTDVIDPSRMPLTRLVNSAIDGVAERREAVADDLAAYAGTDLVAYRAGEPERLVEAQSAAWDPVIAWARELFGIRLVLSEGVMHVRQPDASVERLRAAIGAIEDPFALAALHAMTTLTGSLLIALAVLHGRLTPEQAWDAAHVDECFQVSVWGTDSEAETRLTARKAEFGAAAEVARLVT